MQDETQDETKESSSRCPEMLKPRLLMVVSIILLVAVVALSVILFQQQQRQVVATVNGERITRDLLFEAMYVQVGAEALNQIVSKRLIAQEGARLGIEVKEEEIDVEVDKIVNESFLGVAEDFNNALETYGLTIETFREDLRLNILLRKLAMARMDVSEDKARQYFETNRQKFDLPEEVEARHILVET
ncbi:MAG TPA: SurA N-terminal domain-containing protein, partial [Candidatus Limnocylindrales bacterium]|nr:SurA N-terminal domain-containing protein [Candidatus Limnocylindrales bacterium]